MKVTKYLGASQGFDVVYQQTRGGLITIGATAIVDVDLDTAIKHATVLLDILKELKKEHPPTRKEGGGGMGGLG